MHCSECGFDVPDDVSLCPQCGTTVEETIPTPALKPKQAGDGAGSPLPDEAPSSWWHRVRPYLFWGFAFFLILVISIGGAAYAGLYQGERDREQRRQELAEQHYQLGLDRLANGNHALAKAEFEYVLELDPDHPLAPQGLTNIEATKTAQPTPTTESQTAIVDELYQQAVADYEAERWKDAASTLTQIRQLDLDYETERVEEMLFDSFYNAGMALLEEDRLEEGIFYLDRAVALRPLDEEAKEQRKLAMMYMTALGYWGVDWERCIERFEELYVIAPNYKDVFQRIYRARVNYAEAWYEQGEMCPAKTQYDQALQLIESPQIQQKRAEAAEICLQATPTPIPTLEGSRPVTVTELPPGFSLGRLAYPVYSTESGLYDIYALFADGRLQQMAAGADQPFWMWNSGALGYRNLLSPGLSLVTLGGAPQQLASGAGLAWPTFSPDGGRMAYAAQDAGGIWQVYIAPVDGSAEPTLHAQGKGPAWGPTGLLAWTGCEADGVTCGIFLDNPDDESPPTRISGSSSDIGLSWSPGGNKLAYMSNHTGNWEIYTYDVGGGFGVLTDNPASDGLPTWAPDGSSVAFVSNRDGTWKLYVMRPDGSNVQQILVLGPNLPAWTSQRISWAP